LTCSQNIYEVAWSHEDKQLQEISPKIWDYPQRPWLFAKAFFTDSLLMLHDKSITAEKYKDRDSIPS
jgi:hypothetical protein